MQSHAVALVREVVLECMGQPWVYARSILPARSLEAALRPVAGALGRTTVRGC